MSKSKCSFLEDFLYLRLFSICNFWQIFISCNSGARIGLAEDIKALFKIAWEDPDEPDKGFKYIYLTTEDYSKVASTKSVKAILVEDEGEQRY